MKDTTLLVGALTPIITELLKLFPILRTNSLVTSIIAIILVLIGNFLTEGKFTLDSFVASIVIALTTYKMLVQPLAETGGLRSQN